MKIDIY